MKQYFIRLVCFLFVLLIVPSSFSSAYAQVLSNPHFKLQSSYPKNQIIIKPKKGFTVDEVLLSISQSINQYGIGGQNLLQRAFSHYFLQPLFSQEAAQLPQSTMNTLQEAGFQKKRYRTQLKRALSDMLPDLNSIQMIQFANDIAEFEDVLHMLNHHPQIEYAEPNLMYQAINLPNDTYLDPDQDGELSSGAFGNSFKDLYGLENMGMKDVWTTLKPNMPMQAPVTGAVVVAVIDSGVDYNHEDLKKNMWQDANGNYGKDFINGDNEPMDDNGHGSHVAGTIAAIGNNNKGIIGVAPMSRIMALKVLAESGYGNLSAIAEAVRYAADNGADIINMSLGGFGVSSTLEEVIEYAKMLGTLTVVAAGNYNENIENTTPANVAAAITVSAIDPNDQKAEFSNYGEGIDVAAPGVSILSTISATRNLDESQIIGDYYFAMSGTSMASPHAAGLAAIIKHYNPTYSPDQIEVVLKKGADDLGGDGLDSTFGYGRINSDRSLSGVDPTTPNYTLSISQPNSELTVTSNTLEIVGTVHSDSLIHFQLFLTQESSGEEQAAGPLKTEAVISGNLGTITFPDSGTYTVTLKLKMNDWYANKSIKVTYYDPLKPNLDSMSISHPVVEDLDNDGYDEMVIVLNDRTFILNDRKKVIKEWNNQNNWDMGSSSSAFTPIILDVDGDGVKDIIQVEGYLSQDLVIRELNGSEQRISLGFWNLFDQLMVIKGPSGKELVVNQRYVGVSHLEQSLNIRPFINEPVEDMAVVDVDFDGVDELVVLCTEAQNDSIKFVSLDGAIKKEIPIPLAIEDEYHSMTLADIDGDMQYEIILSSRKRVVIINGDGDIVSGWPYLKNVTSEMSTGEEYSPRVMDINQDGNDEIIISYFDGGNTVFIEVLDRFGESIGGGWPVTVSTDSGVSGILIFKQPSSNAYVIAVSTRSDVQLISDNGEILERFKYDTSEDTSYMVKPRLSAAKDTQNQSLSILSHEDNMVPPRLSVVKDAQNQSLSILSQFDLYTNGYSDNQTELMLFPLTPNYTLVDPGDNKYRLNNEQTNAYRSSGISRPIPKLSKYINQAEAIAVSWNIPASVSPISEYKLSAGSTAGAVDVMDWKSIDVTTNYTMNLNNSLKNGQTFYVNIIAKNNTNTWSSVGTSEKILLDNTPPKEIIIGASSVKASSNIIVFSNWVCEEKESGLDYYEYQLTSTRNISNDSPNWKYIGKESQIAITNPVIESSEMYVAIKATNYSGLSSIGFSKPIMIERIATPYPIAAEYISTPQKMHVNWKEPSTDLKISTYAISAGSEKGKTDILDWILTGDTTQITLNVTQPDPPSKPIYINLKAQDIANNWSAIGHSSAIRIDTTAPMTPQVKAGWFKTATAVVINAEWESNDIESNIDYYEYLVTTNKTGVKGAGKWTSVGRDNTAVFVSPNIQYDTYNYVLIRATNMAGLISPIGVSPGLFISNQNIYSEMPVPIVAKYITDVSDVLVRWHTPSSNEVIDQYKISAGTVQGGSDIYSSRLLGKVNSIRLQLSPDLEDNTPVFINLQSRTSSGVWSNEGYSEQATVDTTAPNKPSLSTHTPVISSGDQMNLKWVSDDQGSGIYHYLLSIGSSEGKTDKKKWENIGNVTQYTLPSLDMTEGEVVYVNIAAVDKAGQQSDPGSLKVTFDSQGPDITQLRINDRVLQADDTVEKEIRVFPQFTNRQDVESFQVSLKRANDLEIIDVKHIDDETTIEVKLKPNSQETPYFVEVVAADAIGNQRLMKTQVFHFKAQQQFAVQDRMVFPNPVNPLLENVTIRWRQTKESDVSLYIHDLSGRKVYEFEQRLGVGRHDVQWNGRDQSYSMLPNGVYIGYLVVKQVDGDGVHTGVIKIAVLQ